MSLVGAYQKHVRIPRSERLETASDKKCAVCLDDVTPRDHIFWPTCGHFGHEHCISRMDSCATCRRIFELVRPSVPEILRALGQYRDRIAYVVDDDEFDEKVCDAPVRARILGSEHEVHITVWITAFGVICELADELSGKRLQLTDFVPIEGGLRPDAVSCDRAIRQLATHALISLQVADIELL